MVIFVFFLFFPNQYMAKINSHTKSQTGIVAILFSYFRVGVYPDLEILERALRALASSSEGAASPGSWGQTRGSGGDPKVIYT